ncbi:MAG: CxxxxCH/CxxCH domain-containing protein [Myxococcaceae bacterium]|nr:CxxxxCH/CxxCH domain-containing protein [Myxococcaceae bacterium]
MKRLALLAALLAGCLVPREPAGHDDGTCTACHGDATRPGDALARAAPPKDLRGNSEVRFPGVGAHQRHLEGTGQFPKVACQTCHPVPATPTAEGHNDGRTQVLVSAYDPITRTCAGSACHPAASGEWTKPRPPEQTCGTCHGLPPPPPHPRAGDCVACHGALSPATHVDGVVNRLQPRCDACHGSDPSGAPPRSLDGGTATTQRGVGAHQAHLSGGAASKPVPCETCHEVPATVVTPRHPSGGSAEVRADAGFERGSATCTNACHRLTHPAWVDPGPLACSSCHGAPPPLPHPQMRDCSVCHPVQRALHVDGVLQVAVPTRCDGCHGSAASPAPPRDLDGGSSTSSPGVGAHQAHLVGRGLARPVLCTECHLVPAEVRSTGHLDGVVDVRFSGVAVNGALVPRYAGGTCGNTACHDLSAYVGTPPGPSPRWTDVDGGQASCTACHGQPPAAPHVQRSDCGTCHRLEPMLHVNGHLDFVP